MQRFGRSLFSACLLGVAMGCASDPSIPDASISDASIDAGDATSDTRGDAGGETGSLPLRHPFDAERAERGEAFLYAARGAGIPWEALSNLWVVWGQPGLSDEAYWAEFSRRYGLVPRDDGGLPFGILRDGAEGSIQCLACHTDRIAGQTFIGAGNSRVQLGQLYLDLVELRERAAMFGVTVPPVPEVWHDAFRDRTAAPGATDAYGMGMTLAIATGAADLETHYGFQQPAAWWQFAFKDRIYSDGTSPSENFRTMMATSLASNATLAEVMAEEANFEDLRHYLLSLRPPAWPFEAPEADAVAAGRAVFEDRCAGCHGSYGAGGDYPDRIVDVGTDAVRHTRLSSAEIDWLNATWFGEDPLMETAGYLAPPLVGVWATAPYFHNGSVPDLRSVLRPSERPALWCHEGSGDEYDVERVGIAYSASSPGLCYDTAIAGLSADGHDFAEDLGDVDIDALLAFLKTL
ncbi:MAG: hypothetical protein AB8H86_21080 [Polyangiales bacterium]